MKLHQCRLIAVVVGRPQQLAADAAPGHGLEVSPRRICFRNHFLVVIAPPVRPPEMLKCLLPAQPERTIFLAADQSAGLLATAESHVETFTCTKNQLGEIKNRVGAPARKDLLGQTVQSSFYRHDCCRKALRGHDLFALPRTVSVVVAATPPTFLKPLSPVTPAFTPVVTATPFIIPPVPAPVVTTTPVPIAISPVLPFPFAPAAITFPVVIATTSALGFSTFLPLRLAPGPSRTKIERVEIKKGVFGRLRCLGFVAHQSVMLTEKTSALERARSKSRRSPITLNPSDNGSRGSPRRSAPEPRTQVQVRPHRKSRRVDLHGWPPRWWRPQNRAACSRRSPW